MSQPQLHVLALIAAMCATFAVPGQAGANGLDLYGLGTRGTAMAGAQVAAADDFSAVYYNMANLAFADTGMGVGFVFAADDVHIRLKPRPDGYDLPDLGRNSARVPSSFRLNPRSNLDDIPNTYSLFIGVNASIGIPNLRLGAVAFLPVNRLGLQRTHFPDEREQYFSNQLHFEFLGERAQQQVVLVGASYALLPQLSIGAGISFLPELTGTTNVYVDNPTDQSQVDLQFDQNQSGRVAPHAGLQWAPVEEFRVGLAYRGELWLSLTGSNELQIRGFQEQEFPVIQEYEVVLNYRPHQFVAGLAYDIDDFVFALDTTWAVWSRYMTHQGKDTVTMSDTLSVRMGVEWHWSETTDLRVGLGYEPSPVPDQTGRTNIVDNDRVLVGVGTGHRTSFFDYPIVVGWYAQWQHLLPRDTNKAPLSEYPDCQPDETELCDEIPDDTVNPATGELVPAYQGLQTGNPGFPGFQSYGEVLALGFDVTWEF